MEKIFSEGYVVFVLSLIKDQECWYLFLFGVYYFKKFEQIGGVFDFFVKYGNIFLNDVLMLGFDFINGLLGVLFCFRQ